MKNSKFQSRDSKENRDGSFPNRRYESPTQRTPSASSRAVLGAALAITALSVRTSALAQTGSIDWLTLDGGGGASAAGAYSISGTVGQPDAGSLRGSRYTLEGGFWGILAAAPAPGAPSLRIVLTATNTVVVAWPSAFGGFALQQNATLGTANWLNVTNAPIRVGSENQAIFSPPPGNRFFRLLSVVPPGLPGSSH
jgi:hypothetical protein